MKLNLIYPACFMLVLAACEKPMLENEEITLDNHQGKGVAQLTVSTRSGEESTVSQGRIYLFDQAGKCVQVLATDDENNVATTQLAAGSYSLYAVGGNDLTRFNLPEQEEASPTSVITRMEGKVMDDLLMKHADVTLTEGENTNLPLTLSHKVICLNQLEIKQVPVNVNKVEVALSPLYSSVRLDGTYPDTPTESYKIALSKQADGTTWSASPQQMLFPSKGMPTIHVTVTTATETLGYSYTANEELSANHHFSISGTYKVSQGVSLSCVLTIADWDDDQSLSFDIDNNSKIAYHPVAGKFCNGYYVVSTDASTKQAVLLAKNNVPYTVPTEGAEPADWQQATATAMESLALPEDITGSWRLPTLSEAEVITKNEQLTTFSEQGNSKVLFCTIDGQFGWAYTKKVDNTYTLKKNTSPFNSSILLQPVIDINY